VQESFDAYQYLQFLRRRSRFIALVCASAGVLALIVSLLLPKQYTATTTVFIDPPAGNDPRTSISVSPIYLESLRTYELFASSDTLFQRAVDKFHLHGQQSAKTLESLKRRILKVNKIRDTKVLEISATLPDPKQAQAFALFLAEETVNLNRDANRENDQDLMNDAQKQLDQAQKRLDQEQAAWREFNSTQPLEVLRAEVESLNALRERVRRDLFDARAEAAEFTGREGVRARVASLEKQDADLQRQIDTKGALLASRENRTDELRQRLRVAQVGWEAATGRLRDLMAASGLRGERLRITDPGVVPERPSSPNVGLNVLLAVVVALIACVTYLTLGFRPVKP
jgi:polysaccharide biosynthesis transport protein